MGRLLSCVAAPSRRARLAPAARAPLAGTGTTSGRPPRGRSAPRRSLGSGAQAPPRHHARTAGFSSRFGAGGRLLLAPEDAPWRRLAAAIARGSFQPPHATRASVSAAAAMIPTTLQVIPLPPRAVDRRAGPTASASRSSGTSSCRTRTSRSTRAGFREVVGGPHHDGMTSIPPPPKALQGESPDTFVGAAPLSHPPVGKGDSSDAAAVRGAHTARTCPLVQGGRHETISNRPKILSSTRTRKLDGPAPNHQSSALPRARALLWATELCRGARGVVVESARGATHQPGVLSHKGCPGTSRAPRSSAGDNGAHRLSGACPGSSFLKVDWHRGLRRAWSCAEDRQGDLPSLTPRARPRPSMPIAPAARVPAAAAACSEAPSEGPESRMECQWLPEQCRGRLRELRARSESHLARPVSFREREGSSAFQLDPRI